MEGVITVKDSRQNLEAMQKWRNEATKTVQQENLKNGFQNVANIALDVAKIGTLAVGSVATVVAALSPAPVLSPVIAKASMALAGAVEGSKQLLNGVSREEGLQQITASLSDLRGSVKDVSIRDRNIVSPAAPTPINTHVDAYQDSRPVAMR